MLDKPSLALRSVAHATATVGLNTHGADVAIGGDILAVDASADRVGTLTLARHHAVLRTRL